MPNYNHVELMGHAGKDAELRSLNNGQDLCSFSMAVDDGYYSKDGGEWVPRVSWFNVTVWGDSAKRVTNDVSKGALVFVIGKLNQRSWEAQDGTKRTTIDVVAQRVIVLKGSNSGNGESQAPRQRQAPRQQELTPADEFKDIRFDPDEDDDIPF